MSWKIAEEKGDLAKGVTEKRITSAALLEPN